MAAGSHLLWIQLLLFSVFQASYSRHVNPGAATLISKTGYADVDKILSLIPITFPDGIDPKNINITKITIKTCVGVREVEHLNNQLRQALTFNNQLNDAAFGLRSDVRMLKLKLATCSATTSATTYTYRTQLHRKMKKLLEMTDSNTFSMLKVMALTCEISVFEQKIKSLTNYSQTGSEINELQIRMRDKIREQGIATEQMKRSHQNSQLILATFTLQNQVWALQREQSKEGKSHDEMNRQFLVLQQQLDSKIRELRGRADTSSSVLELISVQNKIADSQRQITAHTEKSRTLATAAQRQWMEKVNLLKKKVLQLNNEESNSEITKDILTLQLELDQYRVLMSNSKSTANARLIELRKTLEELMKLEHNIRGQIEETELGSQAQLTMETISIMQEVCKLPEGEEQTTMTTTTTTQVTDLQNQLQAKEKEYTRALSILKDLQGKLKLKEDECSGLQYQYEKVKTEFEEKIAELNRTGDSKTALTLSLFTLFVELKALDSLIDATENPDKISELQKQLEEKKQEMTSKFADSEKLFDKPKLIFRIIELQNEIWNLQNNAANEAAEHHLEELQKQLGGLIGEIGEKGNENVKLTLKIMMLQSQVEHLQRQLSDLQTSQTRDISRKTKELTNKTKELEMNINKMNETNQKNANLILTITYLQNQLRDHEQEKNTNAEMSSITIAQLRKNLTTTAMEQSRDQAEIKLLKNKLNVTEAKCLNTKQVVDDLQNTLGNKINELEAKSNSVTSLVLQITTLTRKLGELNKEMQNTEEEDLTKIEELRQMIKEKNKELNAKTEQLNSRSAQPQMFLHIIETQTEIEKLVYAGQNESNYAQILALQDQLNQMIEGIQDENNENTKLIFKILAQNDEIANMKKLKESETQTQLRKMKELEDKLDDTRNQIKTKTKNLDTTADIMELHKKIKPLETEISQLKSTHDEKIAELQQRMNFKERQLQDSRQLLKDSNAEKFDLISEITALKKKLKEAERQENKAAERNANELRQQLATQQKKAKQLEGENADLMNEIQNLKPCCTAVNNQCEEIERQLDQSHADATRLQLQLNEQDASIKGLQQEKQKLTGYVELQNQYDKIERQLDQSHADATRLQLQLNEQDASIKGLQQEKQKLTTGYVELQNQYDNMERHLDQSQAEASRLQVQLNEQDANINRLQQEKQKLITAHGELQDQYNDIHNQLDSTEEKTIHPEFATFDPSTANPRLSLSADNTQLTIGQAEQDVADQPGRFDTALAVLGMNGFRGGRHYWEVSIAGKQCYNLGMASESANRRGSIIIMPANGYWTITLNKQGQLRAMDRQVSTIPVKILPLTLGILLDYQQGQISFYDAGKRAHLYTFVGQTFTDKIYPFVNDCVADNEDPITLLSAGSVDWIQ
ncbi:uncharacterized protein LOC143010053 isoform X2 [Genypterus blacodes]|uniref:uncharacterized protein LOC143010053 isoform X2 n=1 Tax=Genypterus blacodes TaxID=154954 RepID=UPI003F7633B5